MRILIYISFLMISIAIIYASDSLSVGKEQISQPVIAFIPKELTLQKPKDSHFLESTVQFLNKGVSSLTIRSISASCKCASGTLLLNNIEPLGIGKMRFSINLEDKDEDSEYYEFYIESNAKNSPITYRIRVIADSIK